MVSKIRDSDASQNSATQSPRINGHFKVLKTRSYGMYFFCLCYSEPLNKTDVVFFAVVNVAVDLFQLFPCFTFCFLLFFVR